MIAIDRGDKISGVKSVLGTFVRYRKETCRAKSGPKKGRKIPCTVKTKKTLSFRRSGDIWIASIKSMRKTDRTKLQVRATDQVGNPGSTVLAVKLKLRTDR